MNKSELFVKSICLATQEKIDGRELACGKLKSNLSDDNFLFYLIELNNSYPNSKVIRKTVQILENCCKTAGDDLSENLFEKLLQSINEGLGRLAESGENGWLGNLNAIIGLVKGKDIVLAQTGNITGYIFRKNKISAIAEKNAKETSFHPLKTFIDITTGQFSPLDRLIFGNFDLFNRISLDRIRTIVKDNDFEKEVDNLYRYLKKNKVHDVNAVFIGVTDDERESSETSLPDLLYIDTPDETLKQFLQKNVLPVLAVIKDFLVKYYPIFMAVLRKYWGHTKTYWRQNVAPRSKRLVGTTISSNLSKMKKKIPEYKNFAGKDNIAGIKIKTNSYLSSKKGSKALPIFKAIWNIAKNLKLLFLQKNRKYLYALLIVIFFIGGYVKLKHNNDRKSEKAKEVQLLNSFDSANEKFRQIRDDLALGKDVENDKIVEALALAEKSGEIPANEEKSSALVKEIKTILDEKTKTIRMYPVNPANFAENLKFISLFSNFIYGINENNKIYSLDTREKEGKLVASLNSGDGTPAAMTSSQQKQSIIFSTSENRLFSMDIATRTVEELKINAETNTWSPSNALATYSSNIYILSSDNGVVWKHSVKDEGYTKGTSYLDTRKVSIRGSIDFAIDGNIYVLTNEGAVLKFVKGTQEIDFGIKNIPAPHDKILIPKKIFTDEDTNSIFVLDEKYERIIKFDKSGDFSTQYVLDGKPIDNFVVNAKLQKIWVLSEGKIYEGNL